jgi:hypothetical protein
MIKKQIMQIMQTMHFSKNNPKHPYLNSKTTVEVLKREKGRILYQSSKSRKRKSTTSSQIPSNPLIPGWYDTEMGQVEQEHQEKEVCGKEYSQERQMDTTRGSGKEPLATTDEEQAHRRPQRRTRSRKKKNSKQLSPLFPGLQKATSKHSRAPTR